MDVESPILPNPQMEVEFQMKTSLFFGHEDTQIIHFHMGRHEASRQKKMWKFKQICEWSLPRLERVMLEKSDIKTPLVSSRTFRSHIQSEQHSAMSSSRVCRGYLTKLLANRWVLCNVTWATKKTLPQSLFFWLYWLVHRMFLSTLILQRRQYSTLFIHRSTQTWLWACDLERRPCWEKMLSEVTPRNWYETWEVRRNVEWKKRVNVFTSFAQKTCKKNTTPDWKLSLYI